MLSLLRAWLGSISWLLLGHGKSVQPELQQIAGQPVCWLFAHRVGTPQEVAVCCNLALWCVCGVYGGVRLGVFAGVGC
jgi:hypothetical protein